MKTLVAGLAGLLLLAGCATAVAPPAGTSRAPGRVAMPVGIAGLERVMGQNAAGLAALFGTPDADFREGAGRKLQFQSPICVLDAYLYPEKGAEPRVTYLDARQRDGTPIDRASCVAALTRRSGGK
ncbi:hypothetical protein ACFO8O_01315 [Hephaestia sp. GCM10023244]|uniref:hypothetical protein n=1 Tax=unclassified Hephaestia TaxID=2631281 RepID=UPI00207794F8|nr:hypothetical protein [Hephaestia sp. MAHUQ-44]MCM8729609.1 hypothetical protein [Hephaestia sp. MAHUQ-44]